MILPGIYAVLSPMAVGLLVGPRCLTGMLAGAIVAGMMLAITMANAGGGFDNAKKYIGKPNRALLVWDMSTLLIPRANISPSVHNLRD